jgi:hypothetical protein
LPTALAVTIVSRSKLFPLGSQLISLSSVSISAASLSFSIVSCSTASAPGNEDLSFTASAHRPCSQGVIFSRAVVTNAILNKLPQKEKPKGIEISTLDKRLELLRR